MCASLLPSTLHPLPPVGFQRTRSKRALEVKLAQPLWHLTMLTTIPLNTALLCCHSIYIIIYYYTYNNNIYIYIYKQDILVSDPSVLLHCLPEKYLGTSRCLYDGPLTCLSRRGLCPPADASLSQLRPLRPFRGDVLLRFSCPGLHSPHTSLVPSCVFLQV